MLRSQTLLSPGSITNALGGVMTINTAVFVLGKLCLVAAVGFAYFMGINLSSAGDDLPAVEIAAAPEADDLRAQVSYNDYSVITARNIFGVKPQTQQQAKKEAPTTLKLRLVGTNVGSKGAPFAIIEDSQKKQQEVFDLNESVFDQAKLVQVLPERVKLERGGKIEILELQEETGGSSGAAVASGGVQPVNDDQTQFSVAEAELEDALANLPRLLSQARAVPYFRNGKSVGMRLFAIRRGSLYEKLGLKNGDIIKAVNNNNLSDPTQALKLFEQLKSERNIGVKLERAGQDVDLSYSIGG